MYFLITWLWLRAWWWWCLLLRTLLWLCSLKRIDFLLNFIYVVLKSSLISCDRWKNTRLPIMTVVIQLCHIHILKVILNRIFATFKISSTILIPVIISVVTRNQTLFVRMSISLICSNSVLLSCKRFNHNRLHPLQTFLIVRHVECEIIWLTIEDDILISLKILSIIVN